jgi:hypothetical protein
MRTKSVVTCLVGLLLLFASSSNAEVRTWTRKNGKTFDAEFVTREGPVVTLKKPDGTEMTVKMPGLSDEDRKYVNQLTKGIGRAQPKEDNDQKPADATWRMMGEYPSLAGGWVESEEGKIYATITQEGNNFVAKSNVFKLEDKADHQYQVEGTISKGGRISAKIISSKDGHESNPGTVTAQLDPDGKTVRAHGKEDWGESDFTWTLKEVSGQPTTLAWRTTGEYPLIAGKWSEWEEKGIFVTVRQDGDKLVANCTYNNDDGVEVQWRAEGTISKDGEITANLKHTKPEGYLSQVRTGKLDPDGNAIHGHAKWDGGEHDFCWALKEPHDAGPAGLAEKPEVATNDKPTPQPDKPAPSPDPEPAADQPKTMIVEAKGSGKDRDEALKDAFRDAVRKVVGAFVEAETVVNNDQVIKDQVLTYSGGCVKTHGILAEESNGGVVQLRIWALVEQDKVVKHLKTASVSVKEFPGTEIFDQLVTRRAKEKAAEAMLRNVLNGFPANCVKAVVDGEPEEVKHNDRGATIRLKVRCEVDADAFAAFRQRLQSILHAIAEKEDEGFYTLEKMPKFGYFHVHGDHDYPSNKLRVVVNTMTTEQWDRMTWKSYFLDFGLASVFDGPASQGGKCRLSLQGKDRQVIYPDEFALPPAVIFRLWNQYDVKKSTNGSVYIENAFFVGTYRGCSGAAYIVPSKTVTRDITLTDNQLQSLKEGKTECKLEFSGNETNK